MSRNRTTPSNNLRTSVVPSTISIDRGIVLRRKTRSSTTNSSLYIPYDGFKKSNPHEGNLNKGRRSKSPFNIFEDKENEIEFEPKARSKDSDSGGKASLNVNKRSEGETVKGLSNLEKKVENNDRKVSKKVSSLEDRFTELQAHMLYMLSKWPQVTSGSGTGVTPTVSVRRPVEQCLKEGEINIKSPPVPALKRKLEGAGWERSFQLDSDRSRKMVKREKESGIGEGDEGNSDKETDENKENQDEIENLKIRISSQEERITMLIENNAKQAEQIKSLISTLKPLIHLPSSVEKLQFEVGALQGHVTELESRLEGVEEGEEVGETSLLL